MKKIIIALIAVLTTMTACAQNQADSVASSENVVVYQLFPTKNMWTFIKLNTRTGQMWQVQYSIEDNQIEVPLSLTTRVLKEEEVNGRFILYSTQNTYNFILLDQIDGRVWQVQWSTESKNRFVIPIY